METIEVRYKPLFTPLNGNTIYHKYYVYTDASGKQYAARGGPTPFGWPFPFGDITTEHGPYEERNPEKGIKGFPDWDPENDDPRETVGEGDDLKSKWEDVKRTIDDIKREKHSYEPEERNSNTTIDTTSKRTGLRETQLDGPGGLNTPGSDNDIRSPLERLIDGIKELYNRARSAFVPPRRDPLVLDLDGDGFETSGANIIVHFDHDGDGFAEATGWIGADDGLLALDRNVNGSIDNGTELFGDQTPLMSGGKAANGFQALAQYDGNADGRIDANDSIWTDLRIWNDRDGNGLSWQGELFNLSDFSISSISLASSPTNVPDGQGNTQSRIGSFEFVGGTTGQIGEYRLSRNLADTVVYNDLPEPDDIAVLPNAEGFGKVYDLHQAMVRDGTGRLKALVEAFIAQTDPAARAATLGQLLLKWTGSENVVPGSRGPNIDAGHLAVLEKFMGEGYMGSNGPNPIAEATASLNEAYRTLVEKVYAELMSQTHLQDLYGSVTYTFDLATRDVVYNLSPVIAQLQSELAANPDTGKVRLGEFTRTLRGLKLQDTIDYLAFRETFIQAGPELGWVIDSAGLPLVDASSPSVSNGTQSAEAIRLQIGSNAWFASLGGDDVVYGSDRTGSFYWSSWNEFLHGEAGNDVLVGGAGNDSISGGLGNDLLDGGLGNDSLSGDVGNDTYIFRRGSGYDQILDFDLVTGNVDRIWLGRRYSAYRCHSAALGNRSDPARQ